MADPFRLSDGAATVLAQICCHENSLPQGAPTSPVISNMICVQMDNELTRLSYQHRCRYTRYADDLTFSSLQAVFPKELGYLEYRGPIARRGEASRNSRAQWFRDQP